MSSSVNNPTVASMVAQTGATIALIKTTDQNIFASDNVYVTWSYAGTLPTRDYALRLHNDIWISPSGDRSTVTDYPGADTSEDHGGATDLWDLAVGFLAPDQVNSTGFGVRWSIGSYNATTKPVGFVEWSDYLQAQTFGFAIPQPASIDGVKVAIERKSIYASRSGVTTVTADVIVMTVYYTEFVQSVRIYQAMFPLLASSFFTSIFCFLGLAKRGVQTRMPNELKFI